MHRTTKTQLIYKEIWMYNIIIKVCKSFEIMYIYVDILCFLYINCGFGSIKVAI